MQNQDATRSNRLADQEISFDLIDDVEAHGLREVAAGVGAAALIGGGVAAFASQTHGHTSFANPPSASRIASDTAQSADDVTDLAGMFGRVALTTASSAPQRATHLVHQGVSAARFDVQSEASSVGVGGGSGAEIADVSITALGTSVQLRSNAINESESTASAASTSAVEAVDASVRTVESTKAWVTQSAGSVFGKTMTAAAKTATRAEATAIHVVSGARTLAEGWSIGLKVLGTDIHSNVNALSATGVVTVTDSSGNVIGQATLSNGGCTLHIVGAQSGATFTLYYPGDAGHLGSTLKWVAPHL